MNKSIYLPEKIIENNKFELIFDEIVDGNFLSQLYKDESIFFIIENMTKTNLINWIFIYIITIKQFKKILKIILGFIYY